MKKLTLSSALLVAFCMPALAMGWSGWGGNQGGNSQGGGGGYRGIPGPIAGGRPPDYCCRLRRLLVNLSPSSRARKII